MILVVDKELEEMLDDEEFIKMVKEKVNSGEIQLDDMEGVIGGITPEQLVFKKCLFDP